MTVIWMEGDDRPAGRGNVSHRHREPRRASSGTKARAAIAWLLFLQQERTDDSLDAEFLSRVGQPNALHIATLNKSGTSDGLPHALPFYLLDFE